ncbi:MAG: hypothetical protein ACKVQC_00465 [Elusimicrobiota bacterium]
MKKVALIALFFTGLISPAIVKAVDAVPSTMFRFYGKITAINNNDHIITVHNKKQKLDAKFNLDDQTSIVSAKKMVPQSELKVGQSLIVSYFAENNQNKAKKITIRKITGFKKNTSTETEK